MSANISIDFDTTKNEIHLFGDITALQKHRYAWRYVRDYLRPSIKDEYIIIPVGDNEPFAIMSNISSMLAKYGFTECQSENSEKVILDYYEEERRFKEFSDKALKIRNNECNKDDFAEFTQSVSNYLTTRSLYPLQLLSAYHMAFSQNACNFSVPGAGKTSIVYGAYAYLHNLPEKDPKHIDRLLIVGPLSSFGPWETEYEECFGRAPKSKRLVGGIDKTAKQDYLISAHPFELTLISYASLISLQKEIGFFLRTNKVMVVLDEAHKAKNTTGGIIAQVVLEISKYSKSRIVLTGTPAPNGYEDIYNVFKFIWPNKNVMGFEVNQLRDITVTGDTSRVTRLIDNISPYFIRIRKSDLNIPQATVHPPVYVPMGPIQQRIYDFIEKKYMDEFMADGIADTSSRFKAALAQARTIRLMQAASDPAMLRAPLQDFIEDEEFVIEAYQAINDSDVLKSILDYESSETPAKYIAVKQLVDKILSENGKVVIWATFIHTIHGLKHYLESYGIPCQELYGATPIEREGIDDDAMLTREKIVRAFQNPDCPFKVIIANPFAVAESISLHKACHNAIYIERSFNAAHFVQSKDRIHRYGLKPGTVTNYYYVLSLNTVDETIDTRLAEKERRMTEIMESMPIPLFYNISEDLGDEDIKALIRDYVRRTKKH
ncbi:MAG: DEAD/DEAH box helicase [Bacillota bacterium]|nr:DEAD/DEAH box helicase [Bacillota bacterium]